MDNFPVEEIDHIYFESFDELCNREKVWPEAVDRSLKPINPRDGLKTIVCHDMKGGYLAEDKLEAMEISNPQSKPFIFAYWHYIDIFIYFSHKFVTVPTVRWINQAHLHDVLCLGTLITEGDTGKALCEKMFSSEENVNKLVEHLVCLCQEFNFDGWLINIENEMEQGLIKNLLLFLYKLKRELKERVGFCAPLIWYDSIKDDGKLEWQNQLNEHNVVFAELVDGFYVNYAWTRSELKQTKNYLEFEKPHIKKENVYFGVDVFGRGSFGGGQWNCHVGVQAARNYGFSVALFAPGWTTECFGDSEDWFCNHRALFQPMCDVFYPHRVRRSFYADFLVGSRINLFEPQRQTMFPFLLESDNLIMTLQGLQVNGAKDSEHILFLTDFRCISQYSVSYNCPDQLNIKVISKQSAEPFSERINIWEIRCIKLNEEPATLTHLSFQVNV